MALKLVASLLLCMLSFFISPAFAQLKYVIDDFEGISPLGAGLDDAGLFAFGNAAVMADQRSVTGQSYSGGTCISINQGPDPEFGGWGKGMGVYVELDPVNDQMNFYVRNAVHGVWKKGDLLSVELQDDDDANGTYDQAQDDQWTASVVLKDDAEWQLVSIPLQRFSDSNCGGDGVFNINHKEGKLLCVLFHLPAFAHTGNGFSDAIWKFDFLCFSQGPLPTGLTVFDAPQASVDAFCHLGAWSIAGNQEHLSNIPAAFDSALGTKGQQPLSVIHFFQPFALAADEDEHWLPSTAEINRLIAQGYLPMITLEDHYVKPDKSTPQPNLYSILEGHYDDFFKEWAHRIREVDGVVLVRLLHEFNGDWYPWCTANNDQNPQLVVRAYRHIHDVFKAADASNVRFVWCPNSMSKPQEDWNYILDAYPGDDYVDFVGIDIYNGAGDGLQPWRSFRKEGIENYFLLTQHLPLKPLIVCETASRERTAAEASDGQDKAAWIVQMSEALRSDMAHVRLLTWFNERPGFVINSSAKTLDSFEHHVIMDPHFRKGTDLLLPIINTKR